MKSKLLLLLLCSSFSFTLYSQNLIIDSLFLCLKSANSDTAKARYYNEIGMQFEPINPDSAIYFYNNTIRLIGNNKKLNSIPEAKILQAQATLNIGWVLCTYKSQFDSAVVVSENAIKIFSLFVQTTNNKLFVKVHKGIAACYTNIGGTYYFRGDYENAIIYYKKSLEMYKPLHESKDQFSFISGCEGLSNGNMNIGVLQYEQGYYPEAIRYYQYAIKNNEELCKNSDRTVVIKGKRGIANCYTNIALVLSEQDEYEKAIEYDQKALKVYIELNDQNGISQTYNNMGVIYENIGLLFRNRNNEFEANRNFAVAIDYFQKSLKIKEEIGNLKGVCSCYNNIGNIFGQQKNYRKAVEYFQKALKIAEELEDKSGQSISLGNLADLNFKLAENPTLSKNEKSRYYSESIKFGQKAYEISKEINAIPYVNINAYSLMNAFKAIGNHSKALEFAEVVISTKDSMFQSEKTEAVIGMEKKYQAEKKQQEIEKQQLQISKKDAEIKEKQAESSRQRIIIVFVVCGLLFVIIVLFVLYRMFAQKKKSNEIITIKNSELEQANEEIKAQRDVVTQQKEQIESIYEEITDSIHYAERIQKAVLPSVEFIESILTSDNIEQSYFILFKPRNIVSGDFYWLHKRNNWLLIAVADCTGHGVPGAFMSMLGVSLLNEIVGRSDVTQADQVLNELRKHVISSLQQRGVSGEQKDGMDMTFCAINMDTLELQFAGANNPCWIIVSHPSSVVNSLIELKPDKQPIGIHTNMVPFTNQEYLLKSGDAIYLMSDGFEDQFGGTNRKKFLAKNLKNLLLSNCHKSMTDQKQIIEKTINDWMSGYEQIDDITLMGIKI